MIRNLRKGHIPPSPLSGGPFSAALIVALVVTGVGGAAWSRPAGAQDPNSASGEKPLRLEDRLPASTPIFFRWDSGSTHGDPPDEGAFDKMFQDPAAKRLLDLVFRGDDSAEQLARLASSKCTATVRSGAFALRLFARDKTNPYPDMVWSFETDQPEKLIEFLEGVFRESIEYFARASGSAIEMSVRPYEDADSSAEQSIGPQVPRIDLVYRVMGSTLLLSTSRGFIGDLLSPGKKRADILSKSEPFLDSKAQLGQTPGDSTCVGFVNLDSFFAPLPAAAKTRLKATGFDGLHSLGFSVGKDATGIQERYFLNAPAPRTGLLALLAFTSGGLDAVKLAPSETFFFLTLHLDMMATLAAARTIPSISGRIRRLEETFRAYTGATFDQLLPALGNEFTIMSSLGTTIGPLPDIAISIEVRSSEKMRSILGGLSREGQKNLKTREIEYLGNTITFVEQPSPSSTGALPSEARATRFLRNLISPSYCLVDGRLLVGVFPQTLKKVLNGSASGHTLEERPVFRGVVSRFPANAGIHLFIDLESALRYGYNAAMPYIQAATENSKDAMGFDPSSLPTVDSLAKHLQPMILSVRSDAKGFYIDSHSSFGSGLLMGIAASVAMTATQRPMPAPAGTNAAMSANSFDEARSLGDLARFDRRDNDAIRLYSEALLLARSDRERGQIRFLRGLVFRRMKRNEKARDDFEAAIGLDYFVGDSLYFIATLLAREGKADEAVAHLEKAIESGWDRYEALRTDPDLLQIADDPGYRSILRRVGDR